MAEPTLEWQVVEVLPNRGMADVAGSALSSAGIPYRIMADDAQGQGLPLGRSGGAELLVPPEHVAAARALLSVDEGMTMDALDADDDWSTPGDDGGAMIDLGIGSAGKILAAILLVALLVSGAISAF